MNEQKFRESLTQDFKGILIQALTDQSRDMRDYTDERVAVSEARLEKRIDESENRILDAIAETQDMFIKPKLEDHERRLLKLEAKIA
ncbi:MAG: hypothetical protein WC813_03105 [Patescibacteria group bacterium]|jgi:hypothetical protein